jgi:hypothetical protein
MYPTKQGVYSFKGEPTEVFCHPEDEQGSACCYWGGLVGFTDPDEWAKFTPDFSPFERYLEKGKPNIGKAIKLLAGSPDYAVCVMTWPWPDGGWYAGIVVTDELNAKKQSLPVWGLREIKGRTPKWDIFDGFKDGVNEHGVTPSKALDTLILTLLRNSKKVLQK